MSLVLNAYWICEGGMLQQNMGVVCSLGISFRCWITKVVVQFRFFKVCVSRTNTARPVELYIKVNWFYSVVLLFYYFQTVVALLSVVTLNRTPVAEWRRTIMCRPWFYIIHVITRAGATHQRNWRQWLQKYVNLHNVCWGVTLKCCAWLKLGLPITPEPNRPIFVFILANL